MRDEQGASSPASNDFHTKSNSAANSPGGPVGFGNEVTSAFHLSSLLLDLELRQACGITYHHSVQSTEGCKC